MKKLKYIVLFAAVITMAVFSCKKDAPVTQTVDFGYNYFPNEVGSYVIYDVDSISYDDKADNRDTFRFQLEEVIDSIFIDNSNRPTMRLARYYKKYNDTVPYASMPWSYPRIWYANRTTSTAEKVEENVRYIKIVFPAVKKKKWDGNVFNTHGKKEYEITSMDQGETINSLHWDSVLTVLQFEQENLVEHIYEAEKYAKNVGLVFKQRDSLNFQGLSIPFEDTIGYTYSQTVVSYGK